MNYSRCELCETGPIGLLYLCRTCSDQLAATLLRLPAVYADLEEMSLPRSRALDQASRRAGLTESPALGNLYAADARGDFRLLLSWRQAMRKDRGLAALPVEGEPARQVAKAAAELAAAVDWIAGSWPAAGDAAREIGSLYRDAVTVTRHEPAVLGFCPALHDGLRCGGVLWRSTESIISCGSCGATYPPGVWGVLREEQRVARREREQSRADAA